MEAKSEPASVGEALLMEIKRIREVVLPAYYEVLRENPLTQITINLMNESVTRAEKALSEGDVVEILLSYEDLKGFEL